MERPSVFQDAETQPINEDYDVDVDAPDAIPRTPLAPAWVKPPPGPLAVKVIKIVAMIHGNGLTVAEFWMHSAGVIQIVLWMPRSAQPVSLCGKVISSRKGRAKAARSVMENFALECAQEIFERELESLANIFESPAGDDIKEESLTSISFPKMVKLVKTKSPNLWAMLFQLGRTKAQQQRNPNKNPANTILIVLAILSYTRTHHRGRLQKLFAIYFKFRGLSAKGFDTLHAIGLTMSNKWTGDAVDRISAEGMEAMKRLMDKFPWIMSYDNALVAFRVFSQRIDKKSSQGSGTAGTVYIKRSAKPLPKEINHMLQEFRREGMKNPLTAKDIFKVSRLADSRRTPHIIFLILHYVFTSPEFDFSTYSGRDHALLQKPAPIRQLPVGKDEITLQYLLGTLNIPEASYEDNARLIIEWLKQLDYSAPDAQKKLGLEQVMAWIGDQLTVDRLRNLFRFRAEDDNSFERLDWLLFPPGWLHIQMAFANSLHKQHLGTAKGRGLSAAFDILKRKGLQTAQTQGTFFHDLNETLHIIAEAQIRELAALVRMGLKKDQADEVKAQSVMFLRDVLPYILLRSAVKHGDVGFMEDMIPFMLFRFVGGKNNNYTGEMLELLQACTVTYRSEGLNIDWEYLKKLHPAIHVIRAVNSHMEFEFNTRIRGRKHTVPKKEEDIRELQKWYRASMVHVFKPGRPNPLQT
ncbi:hypothetical protein B0H14DRAFT_3904294 [Mycena olivaceomarginata]|nr:hypothetical protein B0H14DRAFT_3904294 [Mycena olivaceomarginata]